MHPMLFKSSLAPADNMPAHWELLSQKDLKDYLNLRQYFYDNLRVSRKVDQLESFKDKLQQIKDYIECPDEDEWKRAIVCGVVFLTNAMAINIQQLRILLGKCKSSINGSLQQLGYISQPAGSPVDPELYVKIPYFHREKSEIKKWTVRNSTNPIFTSNKEGSHMSSPEVPHPKNYVREVLSVIEPVELYPSIPPHVWKQYPCPIKFRNKFYTPTFQTAMRA